MSKKAAQKHEGTGRGLFCGICDRRAFDERAPGKPLCPECLALPDDERRAAGLRRLFADEIHQQPCWHYLSFADDSGFLGVCWVRARGLLDAVQIARAQKCDPGGSVQCVSLPRNEEPPMGSAYVLHTDKAEIERLCAQWMKKILP